MLFVCRDSFDASDSQGLESVDHKVHRLEVALSHYRLHRVQLHLCCVSCHGDAKFVAHHFIAYLVHDLRNDRIYLTRHDR